MTTSIRSLQGWFALICGDEVDMGSSCIVDAVNLVFLVGFSVGLLVRCLRRRCHGSERARGWDSAVGAACCAVAAVAHVAAGVWVLIGGESRTVHWGWVVCFVRGLIWIALAVSLSVPLDRWLRIVAPFWWASFSVLEFAFNLTNRVKDRSLLVLDMVSWPVNLLLLFCAVKFAIGSLFHQENESSGQPLLPETIGGRLRLSDASFLGRLGFSWLSPLLRLGYSRPLHLEDVPPLDSEDGALLAYETFAKEWEFQRKDKNRTSNLVLLALSRCYLKEMVLVGFYALLKTVSVSAAPLLLYAFVWYSNRDESNLAMGVILVGCLLIVKLTESLSQRHWFFDSRRYGMRMRSAVIAAIFQKQLKLSSIGRRKHSMGEIVNYIAVDAYRLGDFLWWFHMAWSLPIQLLLSIIIIFGTVGLGALPAIVPLLICAILNVPFAKVLQGSQSNFMVAQDERLRATSEALNNMKIVKLQSWEERFRKTIDALRDVEFKWLKETQLVKAYGTALYWMSPTIVSAVIFAGTAIIGRVPLDARTIFTVLATLRVMSDPVRMLPEVLSVMIQVKVSLDRIDVFLLEDEINEDDVRRSAPENLDVSVQVRDGNFSWELNAATPTLSNINLNVSRGHKVAVCGPVGAGKSSLLYAILGEIPKISGSVDIFGSIAYVSQTSWIQSGTIQDNILFGKPMNKSSYEKAIKCCALDKDIEHFDHGDLTEIGQRGLNLSGGQKQRVQLARAVYNDADTYLLDDPFSAVDAHTAATLFRECVMAALRKKIVILVTHQVEFLVGADKILVMQDGQVTQSGTYEELLKSGTAFEQLVSAHQSSMEKIDFVNHDTKGQRQKTVGDVEFSDLRRIKQNSEGDNSVQGLPAVQLTEDEEKEIGDVGWKPYKDYLQVSKGYLLLAFVILSQSAFVILQSLATYWLAVASQMHQISSGILVGVYATISIISCVFVFLRSWIAAHLGLKASKAFFSALMNSVFKAPMMFFDSTPVGRILTRASSDLSILDFDIPYSISFALAGGIEVIVAVIMMAIATWQVLVVAIPVLILMGYVQGYYLTSARELVRINGTTKAPVMNFAAESLLGVVTIRAFAMMERFIHKNLHLIDIDATLFFHTIASMEWVLVRVETLQSLTILTLTLFLVFLPRGSISPGLSGLCLSYALTLSSTQVFLTRWYSNLENYIISVERIKQFMHISPEPPAVIDEKRPPPSWPQEGRIDLQDLKVKYRPMAPFVLKGITCTFLAGNRVGVVGRTGSGKSTLISALFRLVDPTAGKILIDKLDICTLGLKDLRMKLSIIPQEPTLFRGNVRSNLDPLGLYTDHEIWEALEKCQLKDTVSKLPALLDSSVSDDGENWSAGQRQLFCLGRVLLCKNRILVLDEATASIDPATDAILQIVIKQEFSSCTVITVAHRVPTVTDSDKVMVLSYGKLVEYETPSKLMQTSDSAFAMLVEEYWSNCNRESGHAFT